MKQVFKDIILENQGNELPDVIKREIEIPTDLQIIVSLIGPRRSGKTFMLYNLIKELLQKGVSKEKIVFINFEDERLNVQTSELDLILQAYLEVYPNIDISEVYFFFDEIQNVLGWEKFVRRLFDAKTKKIFVTGSNSKLLSTEIATELRGRAISYTIYPYNFREFLKVNNAPLDVNTQANRSKIINIAEKFMFNGGFPELVNYDSKVRIKILQQYFNVMIYRDIVERYKISNSLVLKFFIKKLFSSVTVPFSINKIYNDLKSLGYKVSNKYLYEYADYCNSVFLTQEVNKFHFSEIKQFKSDKKAYVIDNGLLNSIDFKISKNRGKLFENLVVMEFIKQAKEIFYFKDRYECDIILVEDGEYMPVQISYSVLDKETKERELRGILNACNYLKINKAKLITFDEDDTVNYNGIKVSIESFYRYFGAFN